MTRTDWEVAIEAMYRAESEACSATERDDIAKVRHKMQKILRDM